MNPIMVVRRIRRALSPSTPRKYSAPIEGIQGSRSTNWNSPLPGLYRNHSGTEIRKPTSATAFAIHLMALTFSLLTRSRISAPASGVKRISER